MTTKTITLTTPIKSATGAEIKELVFERRPKTKDILRANENANGSELKMTVYLIAYLAGITPEDVGELDGHDFMNLNNEVKGFLSTAASSSGK